MATYNFTIRATDTAGAFADRTFSINVNNTTLDRFVVVGTTGLARSVDGVTWKNEPGRSGTGVTYGNGRWVVYDATTLTMHTSPDGVNWSSNTLTSTTTATGADLVNWRIGNQGWACLKYVNGRWLGFNYNANNTTSGGSAGAIQCYESADLLTWTQRGNVLVNNSAASMVGGVTDIVYGNGMYIAVGGYAANSTSVTKAIFTSTDLVTWTQRVGINNASNTSGGGTILNVNGLFIASLYNAAATTNNIQTSPDGTTWTPRAHVTLTTGLAYVNGRILNLANSALYRSLDAGATWTSTASGLSAPTQVHANTLSGTTIAAYGNQVMAAAARSSTPNAVYRFNAEGVALTAAVMDASVGAVRGVAARP